MRILQLIDSLAIGGAEKMAVNYANALASAIEFSGLVATRKEGQLQSQLHPSVSYLFLNKKSILDIKAVLRLRNYCKTNRVSHIQAHSSSYFTAFLVKLVFPKITIIWHDHNGLSEFLSTRKSIVLKIASYFFKGIVVVNYQLQVWAIKTLNCKDVLYLPNFTTFSQFEKPTTILKGIAGKRILCLANLRFQKNHLLLLEVARLLKSSHPDWTFHLVGKDFEDAYSGNIKKTILDLELSETVFIYGSCEDTQHCMDQASVCILTSQSEGLPVALLEYGLKQKPVVVTEVGEIPLIIKNGVNGFIVPKHDSTAFYLSLAKLIDDTTLRTSVGQNLYETIQQHHSERAVLANYLTWLKQL